MCISVRFHVHVYMHTESMLSEQEGKWKSEERHEGAYIHLCIHFYQGYGVVGEVHAACLTDLRTELTTKQKSWLSQVYQSASTQVVTEFRGPLDNGQKSTTFCLPPA